MYRFVLLLAFIPHVLSAQTAREHWVLVPELRIGSLDTPDYSLTRVGSLTIGADGSIYAAQPNDRQIRVYDQSGRYVRAIGGEGGGPGEFRSIHRTGWKGDSLWVVDFSQARVTFFSRTGEPLALFMIQGPMLPGISSRPTHPRVVGQDGSVFGEPLTGRLEPREIPLLRMDRAGALLEQLGRIRAQGAFAYIRAEVGGQTFSINSRLPIQQNSLWDYSPVDSTVVLVHRPVSESAEAGRFVVEKLRSASDTVFARRFRYRPLPVVEAAVDDFMDRAADFFGRVAPRAAIRQLLRDSLAIPRFHAPVTKLFIGEDGRIWLQRESLGVPEIEWLMLGRNGQIVGTLHSPADVQLMAANRTHAWGVETDELDVPYIVRYRLVASTR